jgi:hypothetical protein
MVVVGSSDKKSGRVTRTNLVELLALIELQCVL